MSALCAGASVVDLGQEGPAGLCALPYADAAVEAAYLGDVLDQVLPVDLDVIVSELSRVTARYLFMRINRASGAPLASMSREEWERRFFACGWSKHPLCQQLTPYEQLEREPTAMMLAFERLPRQAREDYPVTWLAAERDLHMDMLREAGRRSDAHIARYGLAAQFIEHGARVVDAACGLGYGSALLHDSGSGISVTGLDLGESAIAYARAVFGSRRPGTSFRVADVMTIATYPAATLDVVASFETLEHIADPERFVAAVTRALVPGGRFICSVPNQWVDESGRDPNAFHLHVFDLDGLTRLLQPYLRIDQVLAQFAGGAMKHATAARRFVPVPPGDVDDAEWWVVVATKPEGQDERRGSGAANGGPVDRAGFLAAECRWRERECENLRAQQASLQRMLDERRARVLARALTDPRGVVIFGAGEGGRQAAARWRSLGGQIAAFTDNREALWGRAIDGLPILAPEALASFSAALVVIASSTGADDIAGQLERLGWCRDVDFTTI